MCQHMLSDIIQMHPGGSSFTSDPFVNSFVGWFLDALSASFSGASSSNPGLYMDSFDDESPAGLLCSPADSLTASSSSAGHPIYGCDFGAGSFPSLPTDNMPVAPALSSGTGSRTSHPGNLK
ncbi:uncharacterized protein [Lolium perenne]|uniref:uncharacterized protein isoform X2 n=1 Tax=Lolium perenne TaxID=4522 RepID=UPI003A994369